MLTTITPAVRFAVQNWLSEQFSENTMNTDLHKSVTAAVYAESFPKSYSDYAVKASEEIMAAIASGDDVNANRWAKVIEARQGCGGWYSN